MGAESASVNIPVSGSWVVIENTKSPPIITSLGHPMAIAPVEHQGETRHISRFHQRWATSHKSGRLAGTPLACAFCNTQVLCCPTRQGSCAGYQTMHTFYNDASPLSISLKISVVAPHPGIS